MFVPVLNPCEPSDMKKYNAKTNKKRLMKMISENPVKILAKVTYFFRNLSNFEPLIKHIHLCENEMGS
jgi:chemotaxis methyl-accepting protein methylase